MSASSRTAALAMLEGRASLWRIRVIVSSQQLIRWSDTLAQLLEARLPLNSSLELLAQIEPQLAMISQILAERVRSGVSLAAALGELPQVYDRLYCAMIEAAEQSGQLATALRSLANWWRQRLSWQQERITLLAYPLLLLLGSYAVACIALFHLLPLLTDFGARGWAFTASAWCIANPFAFASISLASFLAISSLLLIPLQESNWLHAWSALALLLRAEIPLLRALQLADPILPKPLRLARQELIDGRPFSVALEGKGSELAVQLIALGERSSDLTHSCASLAQLLGEKQQLRWQRLRQVGVPVILIAIAAIIASVFALFWIPLAEIVDLNT